MSLLTKTIIRALWAIGQVLQVIAAILEIGRWLK